MPIYQYKCSDCGHDMEALQRMSDPLLVDCPKCAKPGLRKQLTAAAFKLNGTGWYETDFKNSGEKKSDSAKTSSKTSSGAANKESAPAKTEGSQSSTAKGSQSSTAKGSQSSTAKGSDSSSASAA